MPIKPSPDLISKSITGALPKEQHNPFHPYKDFAASIPGAFTNMAQQGLQDYADAGVPVPGYAPQQGLSPDILKLLTLIPETSRVGGPPGLGAGGMFKVSPRFYGPGAPDFNVLKNPSPERAKELLKKAKYKELRMIETQDGDVYVWRAEDGLHLDVAPAAGLEVTQNGMDLVNPSSAVFHNVPDNSTINYILHKARRFRMVDREDISSTARDIGNDLFTEINKSLDDVAKKAAGVKK